MGLEDFRRTWGRSPEGMGDYYWDKFLGFKKNPAEFICYLDGGGMRDLFREFQRHLSKAIDPNDGLKANLDKLTGVRS
jgi:hypothetical protein